MLIVADARYLGNEHNEEQGCSHGFLWIVGQENQRNVRASLIIDRAPITPVSRGNLTLPLEASEQPRICQVDADILAVAIRPSHFESRTPKGRNDQPK
jgi:hypothetical protein